MSSSSLPSSFERTQRAALLSALRSYPVAVVTGPRQAGKSTMLRTTLKKWTMVSLEDLDLRNFALADPRGFLRQYPPPLVIDEAQHVPELFSYIQGLVDESGLMGQYVLSGSQQFSLLAGVTQSLAGRAALIELYPMRLHELAQAGRLPKSLDELLLTGGYPALYARDVSPTRYYADYVRTYIERDIRTLTAVQDLGTFQRFMRLCAARTGQLLNLNGLANDCGISQPTANAWMNVLEASYVVKRVAPYFRNYGKRLVKAPKLFFLDTGLCAWLLGIQTPKQLSSHFARGALFETLVVGEALKWQAAFSHGQPVYYWRDNIGNEIDVLIEQGDSLTLVEVKSGQTFQSEWLRSLDTVARHIGQPVKRAVVYGGNIRQSRGNIAVLGWHDLLAAG